MRIDAWRLQEGKIPDALIPSLMPVSANQSVIKKSIPLAKPIAHTVERQGLLMCCQCNVVSNPVLLQLTGNLPSKMFRDAFIRGVHETSKSEGRPDVGLPDTL